ncbi:plexin domain-containing protein 2 [Schistosoma japonicum]|nr:plexin domain-containing protein 2 [Schistosoma japonicum]
MDKHLSCLLTCFTYIITIILSFTMDIQQENNIRDIINRTDTEHLVYDNESYRKTFHYYYTQLIQLNSSPPEILDAFHMKHDSQFSNLGNMKVIAINQVTIVNSSFPIEFYGTKYNRVCLYTNGFMEFENKGQFGFPKRILTSRSMWKEDELQLINTDKIFAVRFQRSEYGENDQSYQVKAICSIFPNGTIQVYYETMPPETSNIKVTGGIIDSIQINFYPIQYSQIYIPSMMIKTGTLVEFEPIPTFCSRQASCETCLGASTPDVACYWCPKISKCSNGGDFHIVDWIEHDCLNQNYSICEASTTVSTEDVFNRTDIQSTLPLITTTETPTTSDTKYPFQQGENYHAEKFTNGNCTPYLFILLQIGLFIVMIGTVVIIRSLVTNHKVNEQLRI